MTENIIFAKPEWIDAATLSDPDSAATNPERLQTQQPGDRWGFGASPRVDIDFGQARSPNLVALIAHNGSASATWKIDASDTQGGLDTPDWTSTEISLWPVTGKPAEVWETLPSIYWRSTALATRRWWRVSITDPDPPAGEFRAGRLYIAPTWQPARNISYGWSIGFLDNTPQFTSLGGQTWPGEQRGIARRLEAQLRYMSEDEMYGEAFELQRTVGLAGDLFVCRDPSATTHLHRQTIYGLFQQLDPLVNAFFQQFETRFVVKELVP